MAQAMATSYAVLLAAMALMLLLGAFPARADAILDRLRAEAASADVEGFVRKAREQKMTATEVRVDRFDPKAMNGPDISTRMAAEAVVEKAGGKPAIRSVRLFAPKPFPVVAFAKVNSFDLMNHYAEGTGGTPVLVARSAATDIGAPFGQGVRQTSETRFRPL